MVLDHGEERFYYDKRPILLKVETWEWKIYHLWVGYWRKKIIEHTLVTGLFHCQFLHLDCQNTFSDPDHSAQKQGLVFYHCVKHHGDEQYFYV